MLDYRLGITVLYLLGLTGCTAWGPQVWVTSEEELSLPAVELADLVVETHNGTIRVTGSEADEEIWVHVVKRVRGTDADEAALALKAIEVRSQTNGSSLELGWRWDGGRRSSWGASVDFELRVPSRLSVTADVHNGKVEVSGLRSGGRLRAHNGSILVESLEGALDAETHNGSLDARGEFSDLRLVTHNGGIGAVIEGRGLANAFISTHNGKVDVVLEDSFSGQLRCDTHNGSIDVDRQGLTVSMAKSNAFSARLGGGDAQLRLETHNGSIRVR